MIRSHRQLYFIMRCTTYHRYLFERNKDSSRYLELRGWHRVIIYRRAGLLRRRSRYGNARRRTENGIYARNRERRMARVIRRIDRLVFVPGRNLLSSSFASPSSSSWSLGERERQSIPGEAGGGEAGEKESRARQRGRESERAERRKRGW